MRHAIVAFALSALAIAADRGSRDPAALLKQAVNKLEKGDGIVARSWKIRKESKRVRTLELAKPYYRQALTLARVALREGMHGDAEILLQLGILERRATHSLVDVINTEAEFYFGRTSTGKAKKLNEEALVLLPRDGRALQLARDIRNAASGNVSSLGVGSR